MTRAATGIIVRGMTNENMIEGAAKGCYAVRGLDPKHEGPFGGWVWVLADGTIGPEYVRKPMARRRRVARIALEDARAIALRLGRERPGWGWTPVL